MELLGLAILGCVVVIIWFARRASTKKHALGVQVELSNIRFDPPLGSELLSHEPIMVTFDYHYTNAEESLYVWAKVNSDELEHSYQGSYDNINPGKGEVSRSFYLKEAGDIESINLEVKNQALDIVFSQLVDVEYKVADNPEMQARAKDGLGSKITSLSFNVSQPAKLEAGTLVYIEIEYDIESDEGIDIWAVPVTDYKMTYEGAGQKLNGKGVVTKWFTVSEAGQLTTVRLVMENIAGETVFAKDVDVEIRFVSNAT